MPIRLGENAYGKNAIHLSKIIRHPDRHDFKQISVDVTLEGDFETVHTVGDNHLVLPTDTQKNTVYTLAANHLTGSIESFGIYLANHFMSNNPQLSKAVVEISEYTWQRIVDDGIAHPTAFVNNGTEKRIAQIVHDRQGIEIKAGIRDLLILKTTHSAFTGYIKDALTTLRETEDRILSTQCEITWQYANGEHDFDTLYNQIRETLLKTFAGHHSLSVQHTLYAMGEEVLKTFDVVREVTLKMPNKHHIPFNLEQFGVKNDNAIFIASDAPYGYITGTVVRS